MNNPIDLTAEDFKTTNYEYDEQQAAIKLAHKVYNMISVYLRDYPHKEKVWSHLKAMVAQELDSRSEN